MLVASHIKPWRTSLPAERLDARNGLTACPTHAVAFDTGLLMVNGGLRIHLAAEIELAAEYDSPGARAAFGRPPLAERLLLPESATPPGTSLARDATWKELEKDALRHEAWSGVIDKQFVPGPETGPGASRSAGDPLDGWMQLCAVILILVLEGPVKAGSVPWQVGQQLSSRGP